VARWEIQFMTALASDIVYAISWNPLRWSSWTIGLLIVACLLGRILLPLTRSPIQRFIREVLLVAPAALFYFLVRGVVDAREADAVRHAEAIIQFEQALGINQEQRLQERILSSGWLIDLVNWIYIWGHWPVIVLVVSWLILFRHERFAVYRNAFLISGAVGMVIFALFPVAPPRLMDGIGFIDTVTDRSNAYRLLQPPSLTNPFAAMPSLHFGWNLLIGIALVREAHSRAARLFGVLMPLAMFSSIILTANHYFLDGLVGGLLVLCGLALGEWLAQPGHDLRRFLPQPGVERQAPQPHASPPPRSLQGTRRSERAR
jgi:hypothetical protein